MLLAPVAQLATAVAAAVTALMVVAEPVVLVLQRAQAPVLMAQPLLAAMEVAGEAAEVLPAATAVTVDLAQAARSLLKNLEPSLNRV